METGDLKLKQDFEDLQLQQRKKMMDRIKSRSQQSTTSQLLDSQSFGVGDDLNLTTQDVMSSNIAGLHTALEDANTRMREEIRELKDETGRLRKNLAEKDYEIKSLNKKIQRMEGDKKLLASAGAVSDTAAMKIVDLSKRNRELTAEKEAEKNKSLKLMKQLAELEKLTNTSSSSSSDTPRKKMSPRNPLTVNPDPIESIEELNDKLQSSYIKMAEYRNQIQELKQELKIANKVLQQEIGEPPASMQLILSSGGSGFRGRTQQIMTLQDKVKDLEQKLKTATGQGNIIRTDRNQERIKSMEKQRKAQMEELRNEIVKANEINIEMQRKIDATKARNKVLVNEVKSLKSQVSVLTEKGTHDNELIMTLMKQHENLQKLVEHNVSAKDNIEKAGIVFSKEVISRQQQEQAEINRLRHLLSERDARLRHLEQNIQELMDGRSSKEPNKSSYQPLAMFSSPSPSRNSINEQQNISPDSLSPAKSPVGNSPPMKKTEDNSVYLRQIDDLRVELTKYQALHKAASIECEKLNEIVKVLTQRSEQSSISCQDLNRSLNDEKRKTTKLEHALDHLKASMKQDSSVIKDPSISGIPPESKISELETLLSIQTDENTALKESLQSTLRAKQEDVAMFHDMMEQTKSVFMDALRSLSSKTQ